jgi:hypothetical protein
VSFFALFLSSFGSYIPELCLAQVSPQALSAEIPLAPAVNVTKDYEFIYPGSFPRDLTIVNCEFTLRLRLQQFLSTGITDQTMLLSIMGSPFTQTIATSGQWPKTSKYYCYRVGASKTQ